MTYGEVSKAICVFLHKSKGVNLDPKYWLYLIPQPFQTFFSKVYKEEEVFIKAYKPDGGLYLTMKTAPNSASVSTYESTVTLEAK